MFRRNSLSGNPDSDKSISDEDEDVNRACPENFVSLAESSDHKKKDMGVASRLDLFEDVHQNDVGFSSDDEVEAPDFDEKMYLDSLRRDVDLSIGLGRDGSTHELDEQLASNEGGQMHFNSVIAVCTVSETLDRYARGKQKQFEPCTWSAADKDARRPVDKYSTVGNDLGINSGRPTMKGRSSSYCQEHKRGTFRSSVWKCKDQDSGSDDEVQDEPETIHTLCMDKSISEFLGCSNAKQISESNLASPVEADIQHGRSRHSMVELLDELQGKRSPHFNCKMGGRRKGKMEHHTVIGSVSSSGQNIISDEDPCEVMDCGSSTEDEDKAENQELAVVESKRRTMADKFQEAFGSSLDDRISSFAVLNKSSNGMFGRLQQVLQRQKERDTEFFKNLQTNIWPKGETGCLDVKILSRSYDAKLIVCQCSLLENEESSLENPHCGNFGKIWTIIFSPRICGDVDLEVSNLVRIHPPWKEVQVLRGGEIIILVTYYSQIYT